MVNREQPDTGTEGRILSAATRIFRERGRDGARMQDIADEAGINKALLHYYFGNKESLFLKVFQGLMEGFFSRLNGILRSEACLDDKIDRLCDAYISMATEHPYVPLFMIHESNRSEGASVRKLLSARGHRPDFEALRIQVDAEAAAGRIRCISAEQLLMNILSLCIFPAIGKPLLQFGMGMSERVFQEMMEERRRIIPAMVKQSLKKTKS